MNRAAVLRYVGISCIVASCAGAPPGPAPSGPLPASGASARLLKSAPSAVGMSDDFASRLEATIEAGIADRVAPGVAVAVGRHGRVVALRGYGRTDWASEAPAVTDSTMYDLASLTKVIGTTTAAMILEEEHRLVLDRPVHDYLPEFDDPAKAGITVRMLLEHRSGLKSYHPLYKQFHTREQYLEQINRRPAKWAPDTKTDYTDWNFIVTGLVVERIAGEPLDRFLAERVFGPLGMRDTGYRPAAALKPRIAPTELNPQTGEKVWGTVHDENAAALGGVSGHAGLFSSARDLAVFAQMLLNGGEYNGVRILRPETVARWTAPQVPGPGRGLGWDKPYKGSSAGRLLSPWSFGHTGFTGTSIWVDPQADLFVVILTNRVNPTRNNPRIDPFRRAVADVVRGAVRDMPLRDWERDQAERPEP